MPVTASQRQKIIRLLTSGKSSRDTAEEVGVNAAQVSAVAAHIKMGRYKMGDDIKQNDKRSHVPENSPLATSRPSSDRSVPSPVLLGRKRDTGDYAYWDPFSPQSLSNQHILIVGGSGSGKTFAAQCLVAELATKAVPSIIFDYAQGFGRESLPAGFQRMTSYDELNVSRDGVSINPLTIFRFDLHGPINVAQRIADTFQRVYSGIGVQQHALIRDTVIGVFARYGIEHDKRDSWQEAAPPFEEIWHELKATSDDFDDNRRSIAARTHSHISTAFVFRTFRKTGHLIEWEDILAKRDGVVAFQLKGLELTTQKVVTEFLLWNLIGYLENSGPAAFRLFIVLDEAHRLSFADNSPVERLIREGRKFGVGLALASQQPEDFPNIAISNTATKLLFQITIASAKFLRTIATGDRPAKPAATAQMLAGFSRGECLLLNNKNADAISIMSFDERSIFRDRTAT